MSTPTLQEQIQRSDKDVAKNWQSLIKDISDHFPVDKPHKCILVHARDSGAYLGKFEIQYLLKLSPEKQELFIRQMARHALVDTKFVTTYEFAGTNWKTGGN